MLFTTTGASRGARLRNSGESQKPSIPGLTANFNSGKTMRVMSRWKVKTWVLLVLGSLAFLMLLILVLPDVDLPDTAFHRGTAPVAVHAQATAAPTAVIVATIPQVHTGTDPGWTLDGQKQPEVIDDPNFRPILLRSIRC